MLGKGPAPNKGNRSLLVVCDSRQAETYSCVQPAFVAALTHWGMPYRLHDLASGAISPEQLAGCAAIVLAQQNLGPALDQDTAQAIAEAVADGLGYVGGDANLGYLPISLQNVLGVHVQDVQPAVQAQTVDNAHFVSRWQGAGGDLAFCRYRFKRPLELTCVSPSMSRVRVLLESSQRPAMWVTEYGRGRVVQWALPPVLWLRELFGHGEGLDDLLWRGMVWAARKPFAMLSMPPFSTAVVGDAIGSHDFAWIEPLAEYGFVPHVGIFPDDIDAISEVRGQSGFADLAVQAMRRYARAGQAEFSPHAATWDDAFLLYARADGGEIPATELAQRLAAIDKQLARYGVPWSRTLNPHCGQLGKNALPFLLDRGVQFTLENHLPGESYDGDHRLWGAAPYDHPGFTISPLPQAPDFFVVTSGRSLHRAAIPTGPRSYRLRENNKADDDLMWGHTRWNGQCRIDDWDAMAQAAVRQIRLGLNALFFASPRTNEQTIASVTLEDWRALWHEIDRRVACYERWPARYSDVAAYARARYHTHLADAHMDGASLVCELDGNPDTSLFVSVWSDLGDSDLITLRYDEISPFSNTQRAVLTAH
ncbi:MAG: hypothetical protein JXA89_00045 [Anaerolineae bacterium]|nr:hypothetical protein [Anaerolineae bacterium]